jgi:hypothetical protein
MDEIVLQLINNYFKRMLLVCWFSFYCFAGVLLDAVLLGFNELCNLSNGWEVAGRGFLEGKTFFAK